MFVGDTDDEILISPRGPPSTTSNPIISSAGSIGPLLDLGHPRE